MADLRSITAPYGVHDPDIGGTKVDHATARFLARLAQRSSRRGVLAGLGKLALAAVGATVVAEVLPFDRVVADAASCGDWNLCGFCGTLCTCYTGAGENYYPGCATLGSYWSKCCCQTAWWNCSWQFYWDAFATGSCCTPCCGGCTRCCNSGYPGGGPYGGNPTNYCCTAVTQGGGC